MAISIVVETVLCLVGEFLALQPTLSLIEFTSLADELIE